MWGHWHQRADERFGDPPRWIQKPSMVRQGWKTQEDPLAVHCFCVCSGSVLLGDLLGVSRSRECKLPSVLWIYPRIFVCVFIVYRHVVRILSLLLYSAICWCVFVALVVSTCQVIGWKDLSENTLTWWGDYLHKAQVEESVCVYFSFVWFVYVPMCPPCPSTIYISYVHDAI